MAALWMPPTHLKAWRLRGALWWGHVLIGISLPLTIWAETPPWKPVTSAELAEDKPQSEPSAPAEILSYRLEIDDTRQYVRDISRTLRIKVYDPGRAVDITRVARFWSGPANGYYELRARLTLPDGSSRDFGEQDLRERNVAEAGHASGFWGALTKDSHQVVAERFLAVTGVVKGAVLDVWESEPNIQKTDWIMNSIQRPDAPIKHFEYETRYLLGPRMQHHSFVLNPCGGTASHDERAGIFRFSAENLPSIRRESYSAPDTYFSLTIIETSESIDRALYPRSDKVPIPAPVPLALGPWATLSTAADYQDADKGYASKRVKEKAVELVAGATDPREKARLIFNYVQDLYQRYRTRADLENWYTRYIKSVDELIDLDKIDSTVLRQDDFKFLFVALARSAGLECHSVYHPLRTAFPFRIDMVSERFLSRWTLAVKLGDSWVLCDPCNEVPLGFGALPWDIEGEPALVALPRQQAFLTVPPLPAEGSVTDTKADLELDAEGNLRGECIRTLTGHAAHAARLRLNDTGREEWGRLARSLFGLENSSGEVRLTGVDGFNAPDEPLRLHAAVEWPAYAPVLGDRLNFVLSVWTEGRAPLLSESERKTPVFFDFPNVERETITVRLPKGFLPGSLPKPIAATSGDFSYSLAVTQDRGRGILEVERAATNRAIAIPVADYAPARDWFRRLSVADQIGVMLVHSQGAAPN